MNLRTKKSLGMGGESGRVARKMPVSVERRSNWRSNGDPMEIK
jgi:hypothetical protein